VWGNITQEAKINLKSEILCLLAGDEKKGTKQYGAEAWKKKRNARKKTRSKTLSWGKNAPVSSP